MNSEDLKNLHREGDILFCKEHIVDQNIYKGQEFVVRKYLENWTIPSYDLIKVGRIGKKICDWDHFYITIDLINTKFVNVTRLKKLEKINENNKL